MDLIAAIEQADEIQMDLILNAVMHRYEALFPDRQINIICLKKEANREQQFEAMIRLLEKVKQRL